MTEDPRSEWDRQGYGSRWATGDECRFLDHLGEHCHKRKAVLVSERIDLLKKYIDAMPLRSNWGFMDPEAVEGHAYNLIEYYETLSQPKEKK